LMENATGEGQRSTTRPSEAAPSPSPAIDSLPSDAAPAEPLDGQPEREAGSGNRDNLMIPVLNVRASDLSDTFTQTRGDGARLHEALDIVAPVGTTVRAAGSGSVEKLYRSRAGGNTVYVRTSDGSTIHYYAHLDEYAEGLKEGQRIRRGQRLGTVGSSGNADDQTPHLHFAILQTTADAEWWEPANAVNPYPLLTGQ
ncbi:MAG: M23 family metallopeptidase, partial [Alphaproteobacteria bacterium]|nr:M23 family metallopeptidase [Alphaproteobacteria bacterium]MBU1756239.1 M23 family metallopeptidase [Alphaproteobacteria bacterium]